MKNIFIVIELFILIPVMFLLFAAFFLCGDVSLLKFLLIDIILIILVAILYKISNENNKN